MIKCVEIKSTKKEIGLLGMETLRREIILKRYFDNCYYSITVQKKQRCTHNPLYVIWKMSFFIVAWSEIIVCSVPYFKSDWFGYYARYISNAVIGNACKDDLQLLLFWFDMQSSYNMRGLLRIFMALRRLLQFIIRAEDW